MKHDAKHGIDNAIISILDDLRDRIANKVANELHEFKVEVKAHRVDANGKIIGSVGDENDPDA